MVVSGYCKQRTGLCAGGEIEFRLPVTAAKLENKCTSLLPMFSDACQAETEAE